MTRDEQFDTVLDRLQHILQLHQEQQTLLDRRVNALARLALIDFFVVVLSLSLLVVLLAVQAPDLRAALVAMNDRLADVAGDMVSVRADMGRMTGHVGTLPAIIAEIDAIHGHVAGMTGNVSAMTANVAAINQRVGSLSLLVQDMGGSFAVLDGTLLAMLHNVNHLAKPMRMFNQMNPFR